MSADQLQNGPHPATPAPFIIWTFRRTGGTNLGQRLFERSPFERSKHEPFNVDRSFGRVTSHWIEHQDEEALLRSLNEICDEKWLIKHCMEMVPEPINQMLAEVSSATGYRHLFLYRKNPLDRLLSLEFAERSGAWGREQAEQGQLDESIFSDSLPIQKILDHEWRCREIAQGTFARLSQHGRRPLAVAFEDLFTSNDAIHPQMVLRTILSFLGLSLNEQQEDKLITQLLNQGEQGTRDQYVRFPNYNELKDALNSLGPLEIPAQSLPTHEPTPFIVWTLRGAGGSTFTHRLLELSGRPSIQNEPFSRNGEHGHIIQAWEAEGDQETLEKTVETIIREAPVIKHCVETVPWEISEALVYASIRRGYRHLFFHRRNAADRLLCLHHSRVTAQRHLNVECSGSDFRSTAPGSDEPALESSPRQPVPVEDLLAHERMCVNLLTQTWDLLSANGASPVALAYEETSQCDPHVTADLLWRLNIPVDRIRSKVWARELLCKGPQETRKLYNCFPRAHELRKRAESLPAFSCGDIRITRLLRNNPWILTYFVDIAPTTLINRDRRFTIGGVVVLSSRAPGTTKLSLKCGDTAYHVAWGRPSPKMATKYPHGKNSECARFVSKAGFEADENQLILSMTTGEEDIPLVEVRYYPDGQR